MYACSGRTYPKTLETVRVPPLAEMAVECPRSIVLVVAADFAVVLDVQSCARMHDAERSVALSLAQALTI
eukprot:COSAG03_NODE_26450_length_259_cov_0.643750_1_plen_69_part_10